MTDNEKKAKESKKVKWVSDKSQIVTVEETLSKLDKKKEKKDE